MQQPPFSTWPKLPHIPLARSGLALQRLLNNSIKQKHNAKMEQQLKQMAFPKIHQNLNP